MSIHLHLSSQADELLSALRPALAAARRRLVLPGNSIPRPVPVLVPNAQLADWLQIRLARDFGLSMGFEFLQPSAYLTRHLASSSGPTTQAPDLAASFSAWQPDALRWHLLPLIDAFATHLGHDPAKPLSPRDRFAFAQLLAAQFDRYARHRPDWPELWSRPSAASADPDELWQRALWRALAPALPPHPARLLAAAASDLRPSAAAASGGGAFLVGADLLDPLLLRSLQALSALGHETSLYLLLPSLGYLGDQTRRQNLDTLLAAAGSADPSEPLELGGHPLLSSLGQQAVGTFHLLEQISPDYAAWPDVTATFAPPPPDAPLLGRLQADIRAQRTPPGPPPAPDAPDLRPPLDPADLSLRIHSCHGPRRELEVLRDELLRAFAELPDLLPEQVLVAVTDFDLYAPLAEAILRSGERPLPLRLTAIPAREANPVAVALLALLRLASGRHSASELIDLLDLGAVQHHLGLAADPDALAHLADVVRTSGLTHDIDASARPSADLTGTWRAALDRHLAGAWLGPVTSARDADAAFVHPLAPELHRDDETRLRFLAWLTRLAEAQLAWRAEAPAAAWAARLLSAVDQLLSAEELDDHAAAVRRILGELASVGADTPLDAGALFDWLQPVLENATSLRTSLGGEILLGRLDQLHGLPCRVFALLGLQDGAFPRASRRPAWDLLSKSPERWDADPRRQDRQAFLDAVLAPADRLILTAANRSLRTAHDGPLSSCVEELLRAAAATVRLPAAASLVVEHPIQPFSPAYFAASDLGRSTFDLRPSAAGGVIPPSFDARSARIATGLRSTSTLPPLTPFHSPAPPPASAPQTTSQSLIDNTPVAPFASFSASLPGLASFWKDPARAWLRALRVEVPEAEADDTALDDSPLVLDGLQAYSAHDHALRARLPAARLSPAEAGSLLVADRALPPGALGELAWRRHQRAVAPLVAPLSALLAQARPTPFALRLDPATELTGELLLVPPAAPGDPDRVLVYRPGKYKKKPAHQITAFLHALAAAVLLDRPVACLVGGLDDEDTPLQRLAALEPAEARLHLAALVAGFREGQTAPLCYAPATSAALAARLASAGGSDPEALAAAAAEWASTGFDSSPDGEGHSPAARLAWRDLDPFVPSTPRAAAWLAWARAIATPLHAWWETAEPLA